MCHRANRVGFEGPRGLSRVASRQSRRLSPRDRRIDRDCGADAASDLSHESLGANDVIRPGFGFAMASTYGIRVVSRGRSGFKVVADGSPRVMPLPRGG